MGTHRRVVVLERRVEPQGLKGSASLRFIINRLWFGEPGWVEVVFKVVSQVFKLTISSNNLSRELKSQAISS